MSSKAQERHKSTPLITQPGRGDGPVIQGFAPDKFLEGSAIYTVAPGTVWQASAATDFAYEAGAAVVMPALAGANYVIPNGVEELHLSAPAVTIAFAGRALAGAATRITAQPFNNGGYELDGQVILVGLMQSLIELEAQGTNITVEWFRRGSDEVVDTGLNLNGNGQTLISGRYYAIVSGSNGIKTSREIEVFAFAAEYEIDLDTGFADGGVPPLQTGFRIARTDGTPQLGELAPRAWADLPGEPLSDFARFTTGEIGNENIVLGSLIRGFSPSGPFGTMFGDAIELEISGDFPTTTFTWNPTNENYDVEDLTLADAIRAASGSSGTFTLTPTSFV